MVLTPTSYRSRTPSLRVVLNGQCARLIRRIENSKYMRMQAGEVMAEFENAGILESRSRTQGMYRLRNKVLSSLREDGAGPWNTSLAPVLADQTRR